jgi:hypothetical protein
LFLNYNNPILLLKMPAVWSKPFAPILNSYADQWKVAGSADDRNKIIKAVEKEIANQLADKGTQDVAPSGLKKVCYT